MGFLSAERGIIIFGQKRRLSGLTRNNLKMPGSTKTDGITETKMKKYFLFVCFFTKIF